MSEVGAKRHAEVAAGQAGERLDRALANAFADLSRTRIRGLIDAGLVRVNGRPVTQASLRLKGGETLDITVPPLTEPVPEAQAMPLAIVYEDGDLLVINKPAGLVVHPAKGRADGTLVNALLAHCGDSLSGIGGVRRPGIVHRIDKDTSGLIVVAKNDLAHAGLSAQFEAHTVDRAYEAVVWGAPYPRTGTVTGNIARDPANRLRMTVVRPGRGKPAVTHYRVLQTFDTIASHIASHVECRLETGRTHQIRVHLGSIGHPLLGDPVYGRNPPKVGGVAPEVTEAIAVLKGQALHARRIGFQHPRTAETLVFEGELPSEIKQLLESLRQQDGNIRTRPAATKKLPE